MLPISDWSMSFQTNGSLLNRCGVVPKIMGTSGGKIDALKAAVGSLGKFDLN